MFDYFKLQINTYNYNFNIYLKQAWNHENCCVFLSRWGWKVSSFNHRHK